MKRILETQRLILREFNLDDSQFILELVNSPSWLEFIGDKKVKSIEQAREYLENGPLKSYRNHGFGLWLVALKYSNTPIGMCGLLKRDTLDDIDIGFAFLPAYLRQGYGFEITHATMIYVKNDLNIGRILAITNPNNIASISLLNKLGFSFEGTVEMSENDKVQVYSNFSFGQDRIAINALVTIFFAAFTNTEGSIPNLNAIKKLFIPSGIIINNTDGQCETFNLEAFIAPRQQILQNGKLENFVESERSHKTEIFDNIAHRLSFYTKSGVRNGDYFDGQGVKVFQFIKVKGEWKIVSLAWCDY